MKNKLMAIAIVCATAGVPALTYGAETAGEQAPAGKEAGQSELSLFRASLRMDKREFVKAAMNLDEQEGKKFWSLYHQYEAELMKLNDKRLANIQNYANNFDKITDAKADQLVKHALEFRKARTALLENYYGKIAKATSKTVGARFLQVENVLQGSGDVAVGAAVPLMPKE